MKVTMEELKSYHGGYWRYEFLDFYYLHNFYFPPEEMLAIIQNDLKCLINQYPSSQRSLARMLAEWNDELYFDERHLVVVNGSSELIRILNRFVSKITVPMPTFNEYFQNSKARIHIHKLSEEENFRLDLNRLAESIRNSGSEFAVVCNPNNPTGDLVSKKEVKDLLKTGVNLILDESFIDWSGTENSCEDMVLEFPNLIVVKSLTKVMGVAGLRLGYMITSNEAIRAAVQEALPIWNVNAIAERFIELFPGYKKQYLESLKKGREDREHLWKELKRIPFLEPMESHANFILCKCFCQAKDLSRFLYDRHNILIKDSLNQEFPAQHHYVRISVRPKKDVEILLSALDKFPQSHT